MFSTSFQFDDGVELQLHSEYRSTYRWHEYTGPRQEVVRRPPQPNAAPAAGKPLNVTVYQIDNAPRHHLITSSLLGEKTDSQQSSKQEDDVHNELPKLEPAMPRRKKYPDLAYRHHEFLISDGEITANGMCNTESRARVSKHYRNRARTSASGLNKQSRVAQK
jgi:hypothetical protein